MLKLNSCLLCLAGTVSRGSLTNPLQLGSCMQPAMASYCPHQLWLPNKEWLRIGGTDDSLGWSLSVNLSVMGYYLNSHRYHCALPQLVELFSSFAPKTFSLCCPAGFFYLFFIYLPKDTHSGFLMLFFFFFFTDGDYFHPQCASSGRVCDNSALSPAWTYLLPCGSASWRGPWMEGWVLERNEVLTASP